VGEGESKSRVYETENPSDKHDRELFSVLRYNIVIVSFSREWPKSRLVVGVIDSPSRLPHTSLKLLHSFAASAHTPICHFLCKASVYVSCITRYYD
jgi:hypothetical protein